MADNNNSFIVLGSTPSASMDVTVEELLGLNYTQNPTSYSSTSSDTENGKMSHTPPTPSKSIRIVDGEVVSESLTDSSMEHVDNTKTGEVLQASSTGMDSSMPIEISEYKYLIRKMGEENDQLKETMRAAEEQANRDQQQMATLEKELNELQDQIKFERSSAFAEATEMTKALSEKDSIVKNQAYLITRLEQEKQEAMAKAVPDNDGLQNIAQEEHNRQLKTLQQKLSVVTAEKSELEVMITDYKNRLKRLEDNQTAAQELFTKNRMQIALQVKELAASNDKIKDLQKQVELLQSQLEMNEHGSYQERTTADLSLTTTSVQVDQNYDFAIICPLCDKPWKDLSNLQEHVEDCIMWDENC